MILAVTSHVPGIHELSIGRAFLSKLQEELSLQSEDLHPVVVLVRDDQSAQAVQTDTGRSVELSVSASLRAKLAVESSVPTNEKC